MTLKYLLDTNIVSEPLRPVPAPGILRKHEGEMAIPSVVWHELRGGPSPPARECPDQIGARR